MEQTVLKCSLTVSRKSEVRWRLLALLSGKTSTPSVLVQGESRDATTGRINFTDGAHHFKYKAMLCARSQPWHLPAVLMSGNSCERFSPVSVLQLNAFLQFHVSR